MADSTRAQAQRRARESWAQRVERDRAEAETKRHASNTGIVEREALHYEMWGLVDLLRRLGLWGNNTTNGIPAARKREGF